MCAVVVEVGPDGVLSVELQKTSAGLGFSLDGGKASAHGDRPLNIKRVFKGNVKCKSTSGLKKSYKLCIQY